MVVVGPLPIEVPQGNYTYTATQHGCPCNVHIIYSRMPSFRQMFSVKSLSMRFSHSAASCYSYIQHIISNSLIDSDEAYSTKTLIHTEMYIQFFNYE